MRGLKNILYVNTGGMPLIFLDKFKSLIDDAYGEI